MSAPSGSRSEVANPDTLEKTGPIARVRTGSFRSRQARHEAGQGSSQPSAHESAALVGTLSASGTQGKSGQTIGDSLGAQLRAEILPSPRRPSSIGWRKWLYRLSFGTINTGESREEAERRRLIGVVKSPWRGIHSLVILSGKGGVGKTMVTAAVGSMLAELRRKDMVLATDADPSQAADLAAWIDPSASSTFADVLAENEPERNFDLRFFVGQNTDSGLDVLAANTYSGRPRSELNSDTYAQAHQRLERLYSLLLTDTGVDYWHPVTPGVLRSSNGVLLVASAVPGGAESAVRAIEWLMAEGYEYLVARMVVVINHIRGHDGRKDQMATEHLVATMAGQFNRWVSPDRVVALPYDPHIATGGTLDLNQLQPATWHALLKVTAAVATGLATSWST